MQLYLVGGCVRDEILGVKSKDIDYTVVLTGNENGWHAMGGDPFKVMAYELRSLGFDIKVEKPEFLTIRAIFPKGYEFKGGADFVLARKEGEYSDGRRPDAVEPGTLYDDLARRDLTINAIAKASDGRLIDPFGGIQDIRNRTIRAVGNAYDRIIVEDALRGLRAIRFAITKEFSIDEQISRVLYSAEFRVALRTIGSERIREELEKMLKHSTARTLGFLEEFGLSGGLFNDRTGIRLLPTMKS